MIKVIRIIYGKVTIGEAKNVYILEFSRVWLIAFHLLVRFLSLFLFQGLQRHIPLVIMRDG